MKRQSKPKLFILFLLFSLFYSMNIHAQEQTITIELYKASLTDVFNVIEKETTYRFSYRDVIIDSKKDITISRKKATVSSILKEILGKKNLDFVIVSPRSIVISDKKETKEDSQNQKSIPISGKVIDSEGVPIIGASVAEKGTTNGTLTDINGIFNLRVSPSARLVINYIGSQPQELPIKDQSEFTIIMQENNRILDEVVVVGYGTQKKGNLTGSIATIQAKEITTTTNASLAQSLQGKIPGLQVRQQGGEPGEFNTDINVRGFGAPLYVIDGIARDGSGEFQRLDPNDIESISILKDASAAIYGFNSANGVVLVTTKKGQKGTPRFTYNGSIGFQKPTDIPKMMNAAQLQEMFVDANVNVGLAPTITKEELDKWRQGGPGYESTDWYDEVMRGSAMQTQHNLSVRGGNDAVDYYVSLGHFNEDGLLKSKDINYNRYTLRSNLSVKLNRHLKADVMISGRYDKRTNPGEFFWIFKATQISLPFETPYANNNRNYLARTTHDNPVAMMYKDEVGYDESKNKVFQSSGAITYDAPFLEGLQLKGTVAFDSNNSMGKNLFKTYNVYSYDSNNDTYTGEQRNTPSRITNTNNDFDRLVLQGQVSYNNTFNEIHNVGATFVYEQTKSQSRYSWLLRRYDFFTNDQLNQASTNNQESDGYEDESANMSYIGKLNYNLAGKYLIEFAFRYDGSYRYAPGNRWDLFPVISGGWRISEEKFIKDNLSFLDNLKLRASYGKVGQNAGDPFQYIPGYTVGGGGGYEFINGSYTTGIASPPITNKDLSWYTARILDLGVDLGLFNNKLVFEFDVYQRDREGLLSRRNLSLPNTFGATLPEENLNTDRVRGFDFIVSHQNKINDFSYGLSVNLNYARTMNRYVERAGYRSSMDKWRSGDTNRWNDVLWGYDLGGQFQDYEEIIHSPIQEGGSLGNNRQLPGSFRFNDVNGDGVIDGKDQLPLFWGGQPKLHYGIVLTAGYKGIDFSALFQGSGKYSVRFQEVYAEMLAFNGNTPAYFFDRWHLADPYNPNSEWVPGKWPAVRTSANGAGMYRESSAFRKDASYLRLKNLEIGYTIPSKIVKKYFLESVRIYANGHNLFTFADSFVKPFDPERIEGAFNAGLTYPLTKSFNFGINVTF